MHAQTRALPRYDIGVEAVMLSTEFGFDSVVVYDDPAVPTYGNDRIWDCTAGMQLVRWSGHAQCCSSSRLTIGTMGWPRGGHGAVHFDDWVATVLGASTIPSTASSVHTTSYRLLSRRQRTVCASFSRLIRSRRTQASSCSWHRFHECSPLHRCHRQPSRAHRAMHCPQLRPRSAHALGSCSCIGGMV